MLPDRLNPRLWLRDWLLKPTAAEAAASERIRAKQMQRVRENLAAAVKADAAAPLEVSSS